MKVSGSRCRQGFKSRLEGVGLRKMRSVFLVVEPSKIIFLLQNTSTQKEDIILLCIGYHSIPK